MPRGSSHPSLHPFPSQQVNLSLEIREGHASWSLLPPNKKWETEMIPCSEPPQDPARFHSPFLCHSSIFFFFSCWHIMLNHAVLVSAEQRSESAVCIHLSPSIMGLPPTSTHITPKCAISELRSLYHTGGSHYPSILHVVVYVWQSSSPVGPTLPFPHVSTWFFSALHLCC